MKLIHIPISMLGWRLWVLFLCSVNGTYAETAKPGCEFKFLSPGYYGNKPFQPAEVVSSHDGRLQTTLQVEYQDYKIAGCEAHLRSYDGNLVGKTIRLKPGDTFNLRLKNSLPVETSPQPDDPNTPHNFNVTNFHTHGLHVSPAGNSDNVLVNVDPQTEFEVEIKIPEDHPTGTFWYHAHLHGSTALQVSSGMGGALIIEDKNNPDSLDSIPEIKAAKEDIFMLQQIAYDESGEIENYDYFGPTGWSQTQRLPMINGQIMPVIEMQPGEVRRWRMIHGGVRETFMVGVRDTDKPKSSPAGLWSLYEIAVDGLSLGYINRWSTLELQPGYRSDILVKAPPLPKGKTEAVYYMLDLGTDAKMSLQQVVEAQQVLAKIIVRGKPLDMALPCEKFNTVCAKLARTRPHKNILDSELDGVPQTVQFNIADRFCDSSAGPCITPCDSNDPKQVALGCKTRFMVNDFPFNMDRVRKLELGTASEWTLSSLLVNHPFHIHVNPFQYMRKNPVGKDESIWRDTLLVRQTDPPVKIKSRYTRYIGKFVLHCHILDHEDQGMMQIVEIVAPGSSAHSH